MKVLNLYAGIGGNRKLWTDVEVTAVENNQDIATIYKEFFPDDTVITDDAHKYMLEHYKEYDFIWSSPPCQSHSVCNYFLKGQGIIRFPDMKLYEEIIFLQQIYNSNGCDFNGQYCVENVISYYEPLIKPIELHRHYFWSNFHITKDNFDCDRIHHVSIPIKEAELGIDLTNFNSIRKDKLLRNCVNPKVGLHIFDCAFKFQQNTLELVE